MSMYYLILLYVLLTTTPQHTPHIVKYYSVSSLTRTAYHQYQCKDIYIYTRKLPGIYVGGARYTYNIDGRAPSS